MESREKLHFPPGVILGVGILAVSSASILIRMAQKDVPSLVIAAWRLSVATLLLAPICLARNREEIKRLRRRDWLWLGLSGLFLGLHFASWITSLEYTSVASSVVLVTTTPLWVALLSGVVLREKITPTVWLGLGIAICGSVIVTLSRACSLGENGLSCPEVAASWHGGALWGNALALIGALMAACYMVVGRSVRQRISILTYIFIMYGAGAIFLNGFALAAGYHVLQVPGAAVIWLVLLAVVPQLLGHSSFNWALGYLPAAYVSIALMGEPVGTILLAYLLLGETLLPMEWAGCVLILVGIFLAVRRSAVRA